MYTKIKGEWGLVKFCIVPEDGGDDCYYLGEYDMTDWDKTWNEQVWVDAMKLADEHYGDYGFNVLRLDQAVGLHDGLRELLSELGEI